MERTLTYGKQKSLRTRRKEQKTHRQLALFLRNMEKWQVYLPLRMKGRKRMNLTHAIPVMVRQFAIKPSNTLLPPTSLLRWVVERHRNLSQRTRDRSHVGSKVLRPPNLVRSPYQKRRTKPYSYGEEHTVWTSSRGLALDTGIG